MCSIRSTRLWPVCDGVGVLRRHADQSGVSRMRSGLRRSARLSSRCTHLHCQEADLWESTPGEDSRMSRSPSDARCFPLERPDGHSVSTLVSVLRRDLPLLPDSEQRGVKPPPEREADLSTLMAPRSYPSVDAQWHGIVQRQQRTLTSVRRIQTSEFGTVSFSRSLYSYVYVDLPQLPMFLDPPWLLLSYHSSRFDQPDALTGTLVDLHLLSGRTSALKNYFFNSGSLQKFPTCSFTLAILGPLLRLLCSFHSSKGLIRLGSVVPAVDNSVVLLVSWYFWGAPAWGAYFFFNLLGICFYLI